MTRDNVQLLMNDLFSLERKADTDGTYVTLPVASMSLPRAKPLPEAKALKEKTKWQQFAERKGIQKKSDKNRSGGRESHVFDDAHQSYLPRHGAKSAKNLPLAAWCEELPN
jgi:Ribosome biogenesis regulatory protein (RRS1)